MAREREEVHVQRLHVHRQMGDRLRAVEQHRHAVAVRDPDHLLGRLDHAGDVRHLRHRHQLGPVREHARVAVKLHAARVVGGDEAQLCADPLGQHLPWNQIAVVLDLGQQDLVIRAHVVVAPRPRHQVDRLGGPAGEDDLVRPCGVDESRDPCAGVLILRGGVLAERVQAAVDVRVVRLVVLANRVNDRPRLLRGRRVVQVDERLVVDPLRQDREVGTDPRDIKRVRADAGHAILGGIRGR